MARAQADPVSCLPARQAQQVEGASPSSPPSLLPRGTCMYVWPRTAGWRAAVTGRPAGCRRPPAAGAGRVPRPRPRRQSGAGRRRVGSACRGVQERCSSSHADSRCPVRLAVRYGRQGGDCSGGTGGPFMLFCSPVSLGETVQENCRSVGRSLMKQLAREGRGNGEVRDLVIDYCVFFLCV